MNDEHLIPLLERYAASRDPALRDELFEHYLPLARAVARKFSGRGVETEDLEQVAGMALLKALERFDPSRGFRFVTYAVPTITGDVRNYLRDKSGLMRMPRDMRQRLYQMTQEQERFEREHLRTPTAVELSERMGIAPEEFLALLALRTQNEAVSLDTPVGEEGDTQLSDLLGSTDDRFERMERSEWAQWLLSKVGDTERELLTLRYRDGLGQRETGRFSFSVKWLCAPRGPDAGLVFSLSWFARSAACGPWRPRHNEAWNVKGGWRVCNRTPINRRILIRRDRPAP